MSDAGPVTCPVENCSFDGSLSQVIHHVTEQSDNTHSWGQLGYTHSYEFRRQYRTSADGAADDRSGEDRRQSEDKIALQDVDAIGDTRAQALRTAGYESVKGVADASVERLSDIPKISRATAKCIQATAQAALGYEESFVVEIADAFDVDRTAVADAYGSIASAVVPPEEARPTLAQLFTDEPTDSVVELTSYSVQTRHFLRESGFNTIIDVADASIDELRDVPYLSEQVARHIRESAREQAPDVSGLADDTVETPSEATTQSDTVDIPAAMREHDQWLLWKATDDGRKVPRAPWTTGDPLQYVSAMEPDNWTTYAEAKRWQSKLPHDLELAFTLTGHDEIIFIDLDNVRTPAGLSEPAQSLLDDTESYAAVSTSGTGVHIFGRGSLSEEVKSITGSFEGDETGSFEVYDRNRFIAVTGDHLDSSPAQLTDLKPIVERLEAKFATVSSQTPDRATTEPRRSRSELRDLDTTTEIQDVFDAIHQTRPDDIRMRSSKTKERNDGTASYDPSWVHSESGTRLAVTSEGWIYREGMIALNALQLVALEEGLITDEQEYPEGETFWEAVSQLRQRGAHVPRYEPETEVEAESTATDDPAEVDEWKVAQYLNYGDEVRTYIHPYDRDYQESLALELAPDLVEYAESLSLAPPVTYRAAQLYATGHQAGIIQGAAHDATLGAAIRIAATEAGTPRPLDAVAETVDESTKTIRGKMQRFLNDTHLPDEISASDFFPKPRDYLPYILRQLERADDTELERKVSGKLDDVQTAGSSNPISVVAGAVYAVMKASPEYSVTQRMVADATGVTKVTIRNNYKQFSTN